MMVSLRHLAMAEERSLSRRGEVVKRELDSPFIGRKLPVMTDSSSFLGDDIRIIKPWQTITQTIATFLEGF